MNGKRKPALQGDNRPWIAMPLKSRFMRNRVMSSKTLGFGATSPLKVAPKFRFSHNQGNEDNLVTNIPTKNVKIVLSKEKPPKRKKSKKVYNRFDYWRNCSRFIFDIKHTSFFKLKFNRKQIRINF